ncbi:hypothetical protein IWX49DRAFT_558088 [Phyllosticta citricarpa]
MRISRRAPANLAADHALCRLHDNIAARGSLALQPRPHLAQLHETEPQLRLRARYRSARQLLVRVQQRLQPAVDAACWHCGVAAVAAVAAAAAAAAASMVACCNDGAGVQVEQVEHVIWAHGRVGHDVGTYDDLGKVNK